MQNKETQTALKNFALFNLAFRPFFLGAATFSLLAIGFWAYYWNFPFTWQFYGGGVWWHAHEMIFGFGAAIVVGFLLTAVQTWTGVPSIKGKTLALLFAIWLIARTLLFTSSQAANIIMASIDVLFLLLSAIAMAYPVFKVKQTRNMAFPFILLAMACLNAASHYALIKQNPALAMNILYAMVMMMALVISIVGGRVIPFFTANASQYQRKDNIKILDLLCFVSILLFAFFALQGFQNIDTYLFVAICFIGAASNFFRLLRWGTQYTLSTPLLWSLHAAYFFIPLGMSFLALWKLNYLTSLSAALHCITVGAMAGMILAMISRVSLGHTGRPLQAPTIIICSFIAIFCAALIRVGMPLLFPHLHQVAIAISGILWISAYGIFVIYYFPILIAPRPDGKNG